jgi:hypothetical protein
MKKQNILLTLICLVWVYPALGQLRLYDNGPYQPNFGISAINNGNVTTDTFYLSGAGKFEITGLVFYVLEVNDLNEPSTVQWSITDEPGKTVLAMGTSNLTILEELDNDNRFLMYGYKVAFYPNAVLPGGTYRLSLYGLTNKWGTWGYWAMNGGVGCESPGCPSEAWLTTAWPNGEVTLVPTGSETFYVEGDLLGESHI